MNINLQLGSQRSPTLHKPAAVSQSVYRAEYFYSFISRSLFVWLVYLTPGSVFYWPPFPFYGNPIVQEKKRAKYSRRLSWPVSAVLAAACTVWTRAGRLPPSSCLSSAPRNGECFHVNRHSGRRPSSLEDSNLRERKILGWRCNRIT